MSVAAERSHSPNHFGHKRHFERTDSTEYQLTNENRSKRSRRRSSSSSDLGDSPQKGAHSDRASTLAALRGLFPDMEEKVLADILDTCGDNIDAAIKRLGQLHLTAHCVADVPEATAAPANPEPSQDSKPGVDTAALPKADSHASVSPPPENAEGPQTPADWVEALVQQMAGAKDVDDARDRASRVLQAFEQAVLRQSARSQPDMTALRNHLNELSRDNHILKRAVAIQNTRMQEACGAKDAEISSLRSALAQYEQKVRTLELSNYSLSMHLRQATETGRGFDTGQRPPDVY
ncbi:hypothetical protein COCOBI_16-3000 [Coccomyxa sp. Obi]|nr:hypothetical protein COCOBI_16-3000 [Coccomyxa sp. Obi]